MRDTPFPGFAVVAKLVLVATAGASTAPHRKLVHIHPTEVIPDHFNDDVAAVVTAVLNDYHEALHVTAVYQRALHGFAACFDDATLQQVLADVRIARIGQDGILQEEDEEEEGEDEEESESSWLDKTKPPTNGDDEDSDEEDVFVDQDSDSESTTIPKLAMQSPAPFHLDRLDGTVDDEYRYHWDGAGVTVYVMDSGIRASHTEFEHRLDVDCFAPVDTDDATIFASSSQQQPQQQQLCHVDSSNHGTHIAGLVGGSTYGVAKQVRLHSVRVRNAQNELTWSNIYAGLDYVVQHHYAARQQQDAHLYYRAIVNMSITGKANAQADAVALRIIQAGVVLVVAAGNQKDDACLRSPVRLPEVIAVAATRSNHQGDVRRDLSNTGTCVTLWAPGSNLISAAADGNDASTTRKSGTSFAAPLVAGAMALYLQAGYSVANLLADAEWIDALADKETTGKFLSLAQLNQRTAMGWIPAAAPSAAPHADGQNGAAPPSHHATAGARPDLALPRPNASRDNDSNDKDMVAGLVLPEHDANQLSASAAVSTFLIGDHFCAETLASLLLGSIVAFLATT